MVSGHLDDRILYDARLSAGGVVAYRLPWGLRLATQAEHFWLTCACSKQMWSTALLVGGAVDLDGRGEITFGAGPGMRFLTQTADSRPSRGIDTPAQTARGRVAAPRGLLSPELRPDAPPRPVHPVVERLLPPPDESRRQHARKHLLRRRRPLHLVWSRPRLGPGLLTQVWPLDPPAGRQRGREGKRA